MAINYGTKTSKHTLAAAALVLALGNAGAIANAAPPNSDCGEVGIPSAMACAPEFMGLTSAILAGAFLSDKDQWGLLCKRDSAVLKVLAIKIDDALLNLAEIDAKAQTLAGAGNPSKQKLAPDDANAISIAAQGTAACLVPLR